MTNNPEKNPDSEKPDLPIHLAELVGKLGTVTETIPVRINFDIIRLFSEGLYQSPHKAIEELVSNSYDAGATSVRIVVPSGDATNDSLWVIDDGSGMDSKGLHDLWQVAYSPKDKPDAPVYRLRKPIGQFGIGKLAAYVLAWRLTHVSKSNGQYSYVSMDFRKVTGNQWHEQNPLSLDLRQIDEQNAKSLLAELEKSDPKGWEMLFGPESVPTWTAAALSDFRNLAAKLKIGTLAWVLSTGLPLTGDFKIYLNGKELESSKTLKQPLAILKIGGNDDPSAMKLIESGVTIIKQNGIAQGLSIPGIGLITGEARIYNDQLTTGKSSQMGRSNGYFIRVRGRVINLNDELFGVDALNHAAWSRFSMVVDADGLRTFLQSSREGVREDTAVDIFREYLHLKFNECRNIYEKQVEKDLIGIDLERLLKGVPSSLIRLPLIDTIKSQALDSNNQTFYIHTPVIENQEDRRKWIEDIEQAFDKSIIESVSYEARGPYSKLAEFDATTRKLTINEEHPFVTKLSRGGKDNGPITLFAQAEILLEVLMRDRGLEPEISMELIIARDRILRSLTGYGPVVAGEAVRLLAAGHLNETAMERAVGYAFEAMGFTFTIRQRVGGQDGIVEAKLGLRGEEYANFKAVFDAKTTAEARVAAGVIPFTRINQFRKDQNAEFAFVVAPGYDGEDNLESSANRSAVDSKITLLKVEDLKKLLELHLKHGVTLVKIRSLFECNYSALDTHKWIELLEAEVNDPCRQVPLTELLKTLEQLKEDSGAPPTVYAARERSTKLKAFKANQLTATINALSVIVGKGWIDVRGDGVVYLDQSPEQILAEVARAMSEELKF